MNLLRVLVTGSGRWRDEGPVVEALNFQLAGSPAGITVIHGGGRGVAEIAGEWAREMLWANLSVRLEVFPAAWDEHGKAAGPIRNRQMVESGVDVCLAFPLGESRGTWDCVERALAAGARVLVFERGVWRVHG